MVNIQKPLSRSSSGLRLKITWLVAVVLVASFCIMMAMHSHLLSTQLPSEIVASHQQQPQNVKQQGSHSFSKTKSCKSQNSCHIHYPIAVTPQTIAEPHDIEFERDNFYMLTQKGFKPGPNQDRIFSITMPPVNSLVAGLFDGHGANGHVTAEMARWDLPSRLLPHLENTDQSAESSQIEQLFTQAFLETDKGRVAHIPGGGCTAVFVWQRGRRIVLSSVGDSTAIIASWNGTSAEILAKAFHHKPALPTERARIEAAGGQVVIPPGRHDSNPFDTSRVLVGPMALAMSRCLGDNEGKKNGVLSAEPAIQILDIPESVSNVFLVLASDGAVDFFTDEEVAQAIGSSLYDDKYGKSLDQVCHELIRSSSGWWSKATNATYRDDMSLLASALTLS